MRKNAALPLDPGPGEKAHRNKWQTYSTFLHEILSASGSLLFRDLYISLELYAQIPFFWEHRDFLTEPADNIIKQNTFWHTGLLKPESGEAALRYFTAHYRFTNEMMKKYLDRLSLEYPQIQESDENLYSWDADLGRDHYYLQITRDIIDKIGIGIYKDREFLPSEEALSRQYQVSIATVRRALSNLNRLGFCKTYNVKGTQVTLFNDRAIYSCMMDKTYKNDTLLYLSSLQFMALAAPAAVALTFDLITEEDLRSLEERFREPYAIPLDLIMDCITARMPLYPFRIILKEVKKCCTGDTIFLSIRRAAKCPIPLTRWVCRPFNICAEKTGKPLPDSSARATATFWSLSVTS
ncbi:MAG: GntR family transcriptional regulator [Blautia marasmi]